MAKSNILVLGVGNVLMSDEGVGVQCIHRLGHYFSFSENVRLFDGGTLGMQLLGPIGEASFLIAVDCAMQGLIPGAISRFSAEELQAASTEKHSMHEVSFLEMLFMAKSMGMLPPTVIRVMEPKDITTAHIGLTAPVAEKLEDLCDCVLEEIKVAGGSFTPKAGAGPWSFDLRIDRD
jgi:hydrogenase maturation protease